MNGDNNYNYNYKYREKSEIVHLEYYLDFLVSTLYRTLSGRVRLALVLFLFFFYWPYIVRHEAYWLKRVDGTT